MSITPPAASTCVQVTAAHAIQAAEKNRGQKLFDEFIKNRALRILSTEQAGRLKETLNPIKPHFIRPHPSFAHLNLPPLKYSLPQFLEFILKRLREDALLIEGIWLSGGGASNALANLDCNDSDFIGFVTAPNFVRIQNLFKDFIINRLPRNYQNNASTIADCYLHKKKRFGVDNECSNGKVAYIGYDDVEFKFVYNPSVPLTIALSDSILISTDGTNQYWGLSCAGAFNDEELSKALQALEQRNLIIPFPQTLRQALFPIARRIGQGFKICDDSIISYALQQFTNEFPLKDQEGLSELFQHYLQNHYPCNPSGRVTFFLNFLSIIQRLPEQERRDYSRALAGVWRRINPSLLVQFATLLEHYPEHAISLLDLARGLFFFAWTEGCPDIAAYTFPFAENAQTPRLHIGLTNQNRTDYLAIQDCPTGVALNFVKALHLLEEIFTNNGDLDQFSHLPQDFGFSSIDLGKEKAEIIQKLLTAFDRPPIATVLEAQYKHHSSRSPIEFYQGLQKMRIRELDAMQIQERLVLSYLQRLRKQSSQLPSNGSLNQLECLAKAVHATNFPDLRPLTSHLEVEGKEPALPAAPMVLSLSLLLEKHAKILSLRTQEELIELFLFVHLIAKRWGSRDDIFLKKCAHCKSTIVNQFIAHKNQEEILALADSLLKKTERQTLTLRRGHQLLAVELLLLLSQNQDLAIHRELRKRIFKGMALAIICNRPKDFAFFVKAFTAISKDRKECIEAEDKLQSLLALNFSSQISEIVGQFLSAVILLDPPLAKELLPHLEGRMHIEDSETVSHALIGNTLFYGNEEESDKAFEAWVKQQSIKQRPSNHFSRMLPLRVKTAVLFLERLMRQKAQEEKTNKIVEYLHRIVQLSQKSIKDCPANAIQETCSSIMQGIGILIGSTSHFQNGEQLRSKAFDAHLLNAKQSNRLLADLLEQHLKQNSIPDREICLAYSFSATELADVDEVIELFQRLISLCITQAESEAHDLAIEIMRQMTSHDVIAKHLNGQFEPLILQLVRELPQSWKTDPQKDEVLRSLLEHLEKQHYLSRMAPNQLIALHQLLLEQQKPNLFKFLWSIVHPLNLFVGEHAQKLCSSICLRVDEDFTRIIHQIGNQSRDPAFFRYLLESLVLNPSMEYFGFVRENLQVLSQLSSSESKIAYRQLFQYVLKLYEANGKSRDESVRFLSEYEEKLLTGFSEADQQSAKADACNSLVEVYATAREPLLMHACRVIKTLELSMSARGILSLLSRVGAATSDQINSEIEKELYAIQSHISTHRYIFLTQAEISSFVQIIRSLKNHPNKQIAELAYAFFTALLQSHSSAFQRPKGTPAIKTSLKPITRLFNEIAELFMKENRISHLVSLDESAPACFTAHLLQPYREKITKYVQNRVEALCKIPLQEASLAAFRRMHAVFITLLPLCVRHASVHGQIGLQGFATACISLLNNRPQERQLTISALLNEADRLNLYREASEKHLSALILLRTRLIDDISQNNHFDMSTLILPHLVAMHNNAKVYFNLANQSALVDSLLFFGNVGIKALLLEGKAKKFEDLLTFLTNLLADPFLKSERASDMRLSLLLRIGFLSKRLLSYPYLLSWVRERYYVYSHVDCSSSFVKNFKEWIENDENEKKITSDWCNLSPAFNQPPIYHVYNIAGLLRNNTAFEEATGSSTQNTIQQLVCRLLKITTESSVFEKNAQDIEQVNNLLLQAQMTASHALEERIRNQFSAAIKEIKAEWEKRAKRQ